jgi:asparagine synthase (glutamine-hydrolysing)
MTSRLKLFFSDAVRTELNGYDACADLYERLPSSYTQWDPFAQAQYLETTGLLPGYILSSQGDRVAMAHAVEGRFPFLDHRVVEFAAALPARLKMKVLDEKHLLKRAFGGLVPPEVARRPKQPYRAPEAKSFVGNGRREDREYVDALLAPDRVAEDGVFDPGAVGKLVAKARVGEAIGIKDNMGFVGVLSTQLLIDRFIRQPG